MKKLYKFFWDCGRMGCVEGLLIADENNVKKAIGKRIYFGEILGKHSEIEGTLNEDDLQILTDNQKDIEIIEKYIGNSFGWNPLNHIQR